MFGDDTNSQSFSAHRPEAAGSEWIMGGAIRVIAADVTLKSRSGGGTASRSRHGVARTGGGAASRAKPEGSAIEWAQDPPRRLCVSQPVRKPIQGALGWAKTATALRVRARLPGNMMKRPRDDSPSSGIGLADSPPPPHRTAEIGL
jgi:hypothetical protein